MRGLLLFGSTEASAALRHEIPIAIVDPVLFAEAGGRRYVVTTHLERDRVKRVLPDAEVLDYFELGFKELVEGGMSFADAGREAEARGVRQVGIDEAIVPGDFPLGLADRLRSDGVVLNVDDAAVELRRRAKTPAELDGIRAAQRAAEGAMAAARDLLARAVPAGAASSWMGARSWPRMSVPLSAQHVRRTAPRARRTSSSPPSGRAAATSRAVGRCLAGFRSRSTSGRGTRRAGAGPTWPERSSSAIPRRETPR